MRDLARTITKELNPGRDLEDITFHNIHGVSDEEFWEASRVNVGNYLNLIKPLARGSGSGGLIGALAGYFAGTSHEGFMAGAFLGLVIDFTQYGIRFSKKYIDAQDFSKPL